MRVGKARALYAGTAVALAVLLVAGCGTGSGEQAGKKESEKETNKECANAEPEAAKFEMNKPGKIAFSKNGDIHTMNPDGSDEADLTAKKFGSESYEQDPAWSPDGERIAFASDRGEDYDFNIYVMDFDGTGVTRLTGSPGDEFAPRWSPDGNKIGFSTEGSEGPAISVMNADGTDATALHILNAPYVGISDWSPDGSRILFLVDRSYTGGEIDTYVMNRDGSCVKQLTDAPGDDSTARWSPDGGKILFGSNRKSSGIYLMNSRGTDLERVLKAPRELSGVDTLRPAWSPDGEKIAWTGKYEGDLGTKIYVMNADGSHVAAIHGKLKTATSLDWQPVGR